MAFFDSGVDRNRIKLKFRVKMIEKNSPDFLFSFAFEKEDYSGLLLVFGQTRSAWILKLGRSVSGEVSWPSFFRVASPS